MFHPSLASAGLRLVGTAFIAALVVACAPEDSGPLAEPQTIPPELEQSIANDRDLLSEIPPVVDDDTSAENEIPQPLSPAPTALPLFGRKVSTPALFSHVEWATLAATELYSPGEPLTGLTSTQVAELLGYAPMQVAKLPSIFAPEGTEIFPDQRSVRQCFSQYGSRPGTLPRVCILQQPTPFQDAIGPQADVFHLETRDLYIEYVFGGWLGVGNSEDAVRAYMWNDRMVPVLRIRYLTNGLFTEISCGGHDCLGLDELVAIAEAQGSEEPFSNRDITIEISRLTFAANCLRLDLLIGGVQTPQGLQPGGVLRPSLVSAIFFEKGSDVPLEMTPIAGGGGGGPNEGGTFDRAQETIYEPSTPFPPLGQMELTVQLVPDPSLAFGGPILFDMTAQADASANCGLQGSRVP